MITNTSNQRVLLIDDDPRVREALAAVLVRDGFEVVAAKDGEDGLELHRRMPFAVVVVDIIMPRKDGIETILDLRPATPGVGIVAMSGGTGSADTEFLDQMDILYELGADRVLTKPFPGHVLAGCVRDLLARAPRPRAGGRRKGRLAGAA